MTLAIAHRGDPLVNVENTLASFRSAVASGADMVEIDCRVTADGHVVVLHDPSLSRLWGVDKEVNRLDWHDLQQVSVDGCQIPDLDEVLREIAVPIMVDLPEPNAVEAVLSEIERQATWGRCLFAGEVESLRLVRNLAPGARIALTWKETSPPTAQLLDELRIEFFNPNWMLANRSVIETMHSLGHSVSVWTVDREAEMTMLIEMDVDALITNRIGALVKVLEDASPWGTKPE
jgi:glycerophosphoryl diester phosphodiesterase